MEGNQDQATIEAHRNHEAAQGQAEGILIDDSARAAFEKEYRDVFSEWEGYEYGSDDFRQATAKMKAMEDSHPDWTEEITNADPSFDKACTAEMACNPCCKGIHKQYNVLIPLVFVDGVKFLLIGFRCVAKNRGK